MTERWETTEEIATALRRFEAAIPGWRRPLAYAIGPVADGPVTFARVNVAEHPLPAAVLATVCGHTTGSAAYRLDAAGLGRAIGLLAPAEACTAYDHPNLAAWRRLHADLGDGEVAAVFLADLDGTADDPYLVALRREALARNGAGPAGVA